MALCQKVSYFFGHCKFLAVKSKYVHMWVFLCQKKSNFNLLEIEDTCLLFIYIPIYNFDWFMKKKESQLEDSISKVVRDMKYVKNIAESISNFQGDVFDFFCMASFMSLELWA